MAEWPREPAPDAKHKYPTFGLAVDLIRELGSSGLSSILNSSIDSPFDSETSRALDALRSLREGRASSEGTWTGIGADVPRIIWNWIGFQADQVRSTVLVQNLVAELETHHPRISRTELLALSYVPTDFLSQLTRRNKNLKMSRRKSEAIRRRALNPQSDLFAAKIGQLIDDARELDHPLARDEAIAKLQRAWHLSLDEIKERERSLGGGKHFSAWSIAVIPLVGYLTVQLESDIRPGRFEVASNLLAGRYASTADAPWQWTGDPQRVRDLFRGGRADGARQWPPVLDHWLRWRILALREARSAYGEAHQALPSPFTAIDVADRIGLEYEQAPRIDQVLREMPLVVETGKSDEPARYREPP